MPIVLDPIDTGTPEGWIDLPSAELYFAGRLHSAPWTASTEKAAALITAQSDLEYCADFVFSDEDKATPSEAMRMAVCEQALLRLNDPDTDVRAALIAQGVTVADLVGEEYRRTAQGTPIAMKARQLLSAYSSDKNKIQGVTLYRKEAQ